MRMGFRTFSLIARNGAQTPFGPFSNGTRTVNLGPSDLHNQHRRATVRFRTYLCAYLPIYRVLDSLVAPSSIARLNLISWQRQGLDLC